MLLRVEELALVGGPAPENPALFAPAEPAAATMIERLVWWANALKRARES